MYPVAGTIGPFEVMSFSIALMIAFLSCAALLYRLFPARGMATDSVMPLVVSAAVGGVLGARLAYVAAHWDHFSAYPGDILRLNEGGLVFYGGVAGGVLAVWFASLLTRLPKAALADAAAVALPLGAAIGRVGCFFNGCCGGVPTDVAWAVTFPGSVAAVHPTQVYDAVYNLALFGVMYILFRRRALPDGSLLWIALAAYGLARFAVESFRTQIAYVGGLSGAQVISVVVVPVALIGLAVTIRRSRRGGEPS